MFVELHEAAERHVEQQRLMLERQKLENERLKVEGEIRLEELRRMREQPGSGTPQGSIMGQVIALLTEDPKLSVRALAAKIGCSPSTISRNEKLKPILQRFRAQRTTGTQVLRRRATGNTSRNTDTDDDGS